MNTDTIFIDEGGYTGQNLLDPNQPVFALASLRMSEAECQELKDKYFSQVKAQELKYSSIKRNRNKTLLKFLDDFRRSPDIKFAVVQKRYAVLSKLVDLVIELSILRYGLDVYEQGGNIAFSNLLYTTMPAFEGEEFFEEILKLFQKMMTDRTMFNYVVFFNTVMNHHYRHREAEVRWFNLARHETLCKMRVCENMTMSSNKMPSKGF